MVFRVQSTIHGISVDSLEWPNVEKQRMLFLFRSISEVPHNYHQLPDTLSPKLDDHRQPYIDLMRTGIEQGTLRNLVNALTIEFMRVEDNFEKMLLNV